VETPYRAYRLGAGRSRLAWSLLAADVLSCTAKSELMPRALACENASQAPVAAVWLTNLLIQLFLIVTLFGQEAFDLVSST
jgi:arginine:ornithine antiporter/lysine permease